MTALGDRIKTRRLELRWTQDKLASEANISKGFLSDLERGNRSGIGANKILELSRALGCGVEYLMTGSGEDQIEQREVQIPRKLSEFASAEGLSFTQVMMLLEMKQQILAHRSDSMSRSNDDFDWKKLYESVKEFLA
ncbi:MAG: hypothetical protein A2283_19195 [Lentisphaerae bacterium RIFOXYA12_FULL_48_11]|nr:MAG: hypothetical protein A2283_19195 [Lentisphaerae bacterium RIFOXYA12_FULL_48_11]